MTELKVEKPRIGHNVVYTTKESEKFEPLDRIRGFVSVDRVTRLREDLSASHVETLVFTKCGLKQLIYHFCWYNQGCYNVWASSYYYHSLKLPSTKVVASITQRRAEIPLWCSNSQTKYFKTMVTYLVTISEEHYSTNTCRECT